MLLILLLVIALVAALIVGSIARSWSSAAREQLSAVASACGIDPDELEARVHEGESMESVAAEHGVDAKQVVHETMRHSRHRWLRFLSGRADWSALDER